MFLYFDLSPWSTVSFGLATLLLDFPIDKKIAMARESVTTQLSNLESDDRRMIAPSADFDTALLRERLSYSGSRKGVSAAGALTAHRHALDLKYWRDISWPSFFFALLVLVIGRISGPASEEWKVTQYNQGLYRLPMAEKETVPTWAFLVWIFASAFALIFLEVYLVRSATLKARVIMGFNTGMAMLEAFFYTVAFTEMGKFWIGEPRPDFIHRCLGSPDAEATFDDKGHIICTHTLKSNARESYPSGHSSTTFSCGVFMTAYFIWTVYYRHVDLPWRSATRRWYSKFGLMMADVGYGLCFWPVVLALFIAGSRVYDHRHSPADVVSGAFLGSLFGIILFARLLSRDYDSLAMHTVHASQARPLLYTATATSSASLNSGASTPRSDVFADSENEDETSTTTTSTARARRR